MGGAVGDAECAAALGSGSLQLLLTGLSANTGLCVCATICTRLPFYINIFILFMFIKQITRI